MQASDTEFEILLKPQAVQKWLSVSRSTVYRWSEAGILPSVRLPGGLIRFKSEDVRAFIDGYYGHEKERKPLKSVRAI